MPVRTDTFEGALRHIEMLPVDDPVRNRLQDRLDEHGLETHKGTLQDICSNAVGAMQEIFWDGYDQSRVQQRQRQPV